VFLAGCSRWLGFVASGGLFHTLRSVEVKAAEKCPAGRWGQKDGGQKDESCCRRTNAWRKNRDGNYIVHLNGFPIGLKFIDPEGSGLLLFHTRHLLSAEAKELASVAYDSEIISLVEGKQLEIAHDDRIAWVTLIEGASHLTDGSVRSLLEKVLAALAAAGLSLTPANRRSPI
jgi:hypothetical protein